MSSLFFWFLKWLVAPLVLLALANALLYWFVDAKQDRDWTVEHAILPTIVFKGDKHNPEITVKNIRDFQWKSKDKPHYREMQFTLNDVIGLKAGVSHFSAISEIAHVFVIIVLDDGRELGISIEARREVGEKFSLHGGLLAQFELIYVVATTDDLFSVRELNNENLHIYPIKATPEKSRELFMLLAKDANDIHNHPRLYHLFFRNCTNQLAKRVSILTDRDYPWYFQTLAPGKTAKILYDLDLIDMPDTGFDDIQAKTRLWKPEK